MNEAAIQINLGSDYLLGLEDNLAARRLTVFFYPLIPYHDGYYFAPFDQQQVQNRALFTSASSLFDLQFDFTYGKMTVSY
jgi:hypothetical protein